MKNARLTLYFIPSPFGLNWSAPTTLARSIALNKYSLKSRFMGHVNIELEFLDSKGKKKYLLTGMSAKSLDATSLLLKKHMGLGILWHSFKGHLEKADELIPELNHYKKSGKRLNFITHNISHEKAQKLNDYYLQYKKNKIGRYYGLVNSPLHGEGAGCSAFGVSFLKIAGLLDKEFTENCSMKVLAPKELIGKPIEKHKPNFISMLLRSKRWALRNEPHKEIYFWDPDKMFHYVKALCANQSTNRYKIVKMNKSYGVEYPLREDIPSIETPKLVSQRPDLTKNTNKDFFS